MILDASPVDGVRAAASGLVDQVVEGDVVAGGCRFATAVAGAPLRRTCEQPVADAARAGEIIAAARERAARRRRGQRAPAAALDALEAALGPSFAAGIARERELFVALRDSAESAALRHLFFAEREAARVEGVGRDTPAREVRAAGVLGFGTMGAGIAMCLADAGIEVRVFEPDDAAWTRGIERVRGLYAAAVTRRRIDDAEARARSERMVRVGAIRDLDPVDLVIEAVVENMALKQRLFAELDRACAPGTILATNTSSLDIHEIAAATARPAAVVGTHFFSPANVMRLVEVVRGRDTSAATLASVMRLCQRLGKVGVVVGVCDGFVGNRMYHRYTRQAYLLLEEGALPAQIDRVMEDFGFAMGPFRVGDLAGLDVSYRVRQHQAASRPADERYCPIPDRLAEQGRHGQKTGAGWYRYETGSRTPLEDPEVERVIAAHCASTGRERRAIGDDEIRERLLYALVNEAAKLLDEGIAVRPGDIDVIWRYGYGFPATRGGPCWMADRVGLATIRDALEHHADRAADERLRPAPLVEQLAANGAGFYDRADSVRG